MPEAAVARARPGRAKTSPAHCSLLVMALEQRGGDRGAAAAALGYTPAQLRQQMRQCGLLQRFPGHPGRRYSGVRPEPDPDDLPDPDEVPDAPPRCFRLRPPPLIAWPEAMELVRIAAHRDVPYRATRMQQRLIGLGWLTTERRPWGMALVVPPRARAAITR